MEHWTNWSGRQTARPTRIMRPTTEAGFSEAVRWAGANGCAVRAIGASHSHSRVAATDGLVVETDGWQGLVSIARTPGREDSGLATIRAGTRIHQLGEPLYGHGFSLINQGDIDRQSVAGAIATGTHGTGPTLGNLSTAVAGFRVVLADGEVVSCSQDDEPDLFDVGRHSLGGVGLVIEIDVAVRGRYQLEERQWTATPDEVFADIDQLVGATRHFEFFWVPEKDVCACKSLDELADDGRAAGLQSSEPEEVSKRHRRGWSHRIISSTRDDLHTEMEYSVPAESGPACFSELRQMIQQDFPDLRWPLEYRTLAADDLLISTARNRPTVTISAHQDISLDDEPLFRACEEIFKRHDGRPHWGKVHYRRGEELAAVHDGYRKWWELRDRYDPDGLFVTPDLADLRP